MGTTKSITNEPQDKVPSAPAAEKQPETPEKMSGPQRVALMAEGSVAPPPNGASAPASGAEALTSGSNGRGAAPRAQMMKNLQRSVGNTRVSNLLGGQIQTKLSVGAADDPQEREADQVAETVTQPGSKSEPSALRQIVMKYSLGRLANDPSEKKEGPKTDRTNDAASAPAKAEARELSPLSLGTEGATTMAPASKGIAPATTPIANVPTGPEQRKAGADNGNAAAADLAPKAAPSASPSPKGTVPDNLVAPAETQAKARADEPETKTKTQNAAQKEEVQEVASGKVEASQKEPSAETTEGVSPVESVDAEMEADPVASLASLIEPVPDESDTAASAEPGITPTAGVETGGESEPLALSPTSSFSEGTISRLVNSTVTVVARTPDPDAEKEKGADENAGPKENVTEKASNPVAAKAKVQRFIAQLDAASTDSKTRIERQAEKTKGRLTESTNTLRKQIDRQVTGLVASLHGAFATERKALQNSVTDTRSQIAASLKTRRAEAVARGVQAKTDLTNLFTQHKTNVTGAVETKITHVEAVRRHHTDVATERTRKQAKVARVRSAHMAASYPATERGVLQGDAVDAVGEETAKEIEERLPDTIEAIDELVEDIPDEFRDQGEEALEGIDDALPDLLAGVDEQVKAAIGALDDQAIEANKALNVLEKQIMDELRASEAVAVAKAQEIAPQAYAQIDAGLTTASSHLHASAPQAGSQIQPVVDEAIEILKQLEIPDVDRSKKMTDQILGFVRDATGDTLAAQQAAGDAMILEFDRIGKGTAAGLLNVETRALEQLAGFSSSGKSKLAGFSTKANELFGGTLKQLDEAFVDAAKQIRTKLNESLTGFTAELNKTLLDANNKITEAVSEGLAKNDEGLIELGPSMEEAADDAAWEHDHPILSTIGDIAGIVAGVIVGIVLVIALVVVAIIAFKVLIAGLVALGVSLAVAELIALVVGLGLLAYGIYSAYQARVAAGQGGWEAFGGALMDVTGITDIKRSFTEKGLSPFERGFAFGKGIATVGTFFLGRRLNAKINSRLPKSITNPSRGSAWKWMRGRFGKGSGRQTGGGCFVAGTPVLTRNGQKAIEKLIEGDEVRATDFTGRTLYQRILQTFKRTVPVLLDIHIGDVLLTCSPEHPFWVVNCGWRKAGELEVGDSLITSQGRSIRCDSIGRRKGAFEVFNIEVDGVHNYYVSSLGILVHNKAMRASPFKLGPNDLDWRGTGKTFNQALEHAFQKTGVPKSEFKITRWGSTEHGKSFPAEWRVTSGPNKGAEVNVDLPHEMHGPTDPHVGWQSPGKRLGGGAQRGHILLDDVPYNR